MWSTRESLEKQYRAQQEIERELACLTSEELKRLKEELFRDSRDTSTDLCETKTSLINTIVGCCDLWMVRQTMKRLGFTRKK